MFRVEFFPAEPLQEFIGFRWVGEAVNVKPLPVIKDGVPSAAYRQILAELVNLLVPVAALTEPRREDEAAALAKRIGYPVALKAQAASLSHKTEAGGVVLNLTEESVLRAAWDMTMRNVKHAAPDVSLDGALVEKMSPKGVELMVGAKRDPGWGTVLLLGLGGIWVEALGDVQVLTGNADGVQILEALGKLRSAKFLTGFRGAPPADLDAVVQVLLAIGQLMQTIPELTEIDVNPLMVHAKGQGATALDALIIRA